MIVCNDCGWRGSGEHDCRGSLLTNLQEARAENERLRGAMEAQDRREQEAGQKCGIPREEHGCDWPDAISERVVHLRAEIERLREALTWAVGFIRCNNLTDPSVYDRYPDMRNAVSLLADRELWSGEFQRVLARAELAEEERDRLREVCGCVLLNLDYLQNLWGKEGLTEGLVAKLRKVVNP